MLRDRILIPRAVLIASLLFMHAPGSCHAQMVGSAVRVPVQTKREEFVWKRIGSPTMSYETAVRDYLVEYRQRYAAFLRDGAAR